MSPGKLWGEELEGQVKLMEWSIARCEKEEAEGADACWQDGEKRQGVDSRRCGSKQEIPSRYWGEGRVS